MNFCSTFMCLLSIVVDICLKKVESGLPLMTDLIYGKFPDDFIWAVASSNYQMEGATRQDGKGENVWDRFINTHRFMISNNATADISDNSYNLWREDIAQLKLMGLKYFRISIAWSRIVPNGTVEEGVNQKALSHYRKVLTALVQAGIEPIVTICHYDLPQKLRDKGGWLNDKIIDWFTDYARICFDNYWDIVKYWITFNSPFLYSNLLLPSAILDAENISVADITECMAECTYQMVHRQLLSHAKVFHLYDKFYRKRLPGSQIGIIADCEWYQPASDDPQDKAAADRSMQFELGWILHPLVKGDYPEVMKEGIGRRSKLQGFSKSRLPKFTNAQIDTIKGTYDFIGLNSYTGFYTRDLSGDKMINSTIFSSDREVDMFYSKDWVLAGDGFRAFVPWGIRYVLKWIKDHYDNPPVIITENGWADINGSVFDSWRVDFFEQTINNVLQAYLIDGCNVKGYIAWAFLDTFEWFGGYDAKYGVIRVDMNDPKRTRQPKLSSRYLAQLARDNGFLKPTMPYAEIWSKKIKEFTNNIDLE